MGVAIRSRVTSCRNLQGGASAGVLACVEHFRAALHEVEQHAESAVLHVVLLCFVALALSGEAMDAVSARDGGRGDAVAGKRDKREKVQMGQWAQGRPRRPPEAEGAEPAYNGVG